MPSVEILPDSGWKEEENKRIEDAKMLIVEDNESIKQMLVSIFETFYQVTTASDGEEAMELIQKDMPSIILSDVVMPRMSGTELCKQIKTDFNTCHIPVVLLTARTAVEHNIEGLKIGADDYITKPFSMEELTFRIEAILRRVRGKKNKESSIYKIGKFTFDTQKQILSTPEKQTKLTTKESELLGLLCAHANEILQRDFALKTIWIDDNYFNARSMDVYITKLRKHLKEDESIEIINIHGKGYKLITPEAES